MNGKLYLCATPIGNLSDISDRLRETLSSVDIIAAEDTRRTLKLLNHLGIKKQMISYYEHNKREKGTELLKILHDGKDIALVSDAGTPAISDPGEDLVALCAENGIDVVPVPGCVAAICALIVSGLPTGRFSFEGFLSVNKRSRGERLEEIKNDQRTLIFYEAPHKLRTTLRDMLETFGNRRIALCRELTKLHEEIIRTDLEKAQTLYSEEKPPKGEFVLVIEGASEDGLKEEINCSVRERYEYFLSQGDDEKTAMKKVAQERGVSKRDIYAEIKID
ncbi:MAG: 16S rRNA (cytidine(1402)-2'-O)-methyltransferase [Clostridia bacterium]|nr:16S rRNA (cytidine(1402)-2'-O)-methyltransferase [Clostridia bacterium]